MDQMLLNIIAAFKRQQESVFEFKTNLNKSLKLSQQFDAQIFLKRDDQQIIRIFKMRGVYNKFCSLSNEERAMGICCFSDGNHAQAVAFFCNHFQIKAITGTIFVPEVIFNWKLDLIQKYGKSWIKVIQIGISFHDSKIAAEQFMKDHKCVYIHPFNDQQIIEGNATMAIEILEDMPGELDYLFIPVGGGGLAAGVSAYVKAMSPNTKIIGVETSAAPSMSRAFQAGKPVQLEGKISRFCDGSAVDSVEDLTFQQCRKYLDEVVTVEEGTLATTILNLYNQGIAVEPSGALGVAILKKFAKQIQGKKVCCIISGGTVDLSRFDEFKEMSLLYEGLKYFFLVQFPLTPGFLKKFVQLCLGPEDDLCHIQYNKKYNREFSPALIAIEVGKKENVQQIMSRMDKMKLSYKNVNDTKDLYDILI